MGTITYAIGGPSVTSSNYIFDELPVCNYPENVSIVGTLPPFMTHDTSNARFEVPSTSDLSFIGTYTFTVLSEITVPTLAAPYTLSNEEEITVIINPCQVDSFTATSSISSIVQAVQEPGQTSTTYEFTQSPNCGYP